MVAAAEADRRGAARVWAALLVGLSGGCRESRTQGGNEAAGTDPAPRAAAGELKVELPAGLELRVDGELWTAGQWGALAAGKHAVRVATPCGVGTAEVSVAAGAQTRLAAEQLSGVRWARLSVSAKLRDGTALQPKVTLNEWAVPIVRGEATTVPACALRLKVTPPDEARVGGYWEDVALQAGKRLTREVTLVPGSDVVRLPGGPFRLGPPGPEHYIHDYLSLLADGYIEPSPGWAEFRTYDVQVEPFELDRTLVTAAQLVRCRQEGGCPMQRAYGLPLTPRVGRKGSYAPCTTTVIDRELVEGRADHPANCVALFEAQQYCAWVGKRLPSDVEWEYAARSENAEFVCPWGGTYETLAPLGKYDMEGQGCTRPGPAKDGWSDSRMDFTTAPVCSHPGADSAQGICDLAGSYSEYVHLARVPGRPPFRGNVAPRPIVDWGFKEPSPDPTFTAPALAFEMRHDVDFSFRCARSVLADPESER